MKTMKRTKIGLMLLLPLAVAGCFTLSQSEYPTVEMTAVAGGVKLQLEGFQSTVIDYTPVYSTSTYVAADPYWHGPYRRHRRGGMYWGTYTTETYVPTVRNTDAFLQRAMSNLEKAGCVLRATPATYTVVCSFAGPSSDEMASLKSLGVFLGSVLSARFEMLSYTAEVKVYETASGKLIYGFGCGLLCMLIRQFGSYPEGCSFAILIMNSVTPLINRWTQPKPFGAR